MQRFSSMKFVVLTRIARVIWFLLAVRCLFKGYGGEMELVVAFAISREISLKVAKGLVK